MFEISDISWGILLVLPTNVASATLTFVVDKWLVDDGWRMDHQFVGDFCKVANSNSRM